MSPHNTGLRFWVAVTTVPLTLLTLANFFAARSPTSAAQAVQWATLNNVRHVLVALASLAALQMFALRHA